ncbi:hypothetical protein K438DRAFT_1806515 [Mycena galopus ATCC 62051]|nr:hypothetical protein K438DRAFT_1806515 [Mycena galopus ATCC 62051]
MHISHPRHVVAQPIPLHYQSILIHALSLYRPRLSSGRQRQSRFVRAFMSNKEDVDVQKRQITAYLHIFTSREHKAQRAASSYTPTSLSASPSPRVSPSTRRSASLQSQDSPTASRNSPLVLSIKTPLPKLISPSKFSLLTPANQVLHNPFHPPELQKLTPSQRHRNRNWQWSPAVSPGIDEDCAPVNTPETPDSPIRELTRRFSLIAPPSSKRVPRRLSYSQAYASPWTPESRHSQALASPAMIRSSFWPSSPVPSPRYHLDDLQFSPFHVVF